MIQKMVDLFSESSEHADNFYTDWLKKYRGTYPPVDYKFTNRHLVLKNLLTKFAPDKEIQILDVGWRTAENAELITEKAFYYRVEISDIALNIARQKYFNRERIFLFLENLKRSILILIASLMNVFYRYLNAGLFIVVEKR